MRAWARARARVCGVDGATGVSERHPSASKAIRGGQHQSQSALLRSAWSCTRKRALRHKGGHACSPGPNPQPHHLSAPPLRGLAQSILLRTHTQRGCSHSLHKRLSKVVPGLASAASAVLPRRPHAAGPPGRSGGWGPDLGFGRWVRHEELDPAHRSLRRNRADLEETAAVDAALDSVNRA